MIGTANKEFYNKINSQVKAGRENLSTLKNRISSLKSDIKTQASQPTPNPQPTKHKGSGTYSVGNDGLAKHSKFRDLLNKGKENPNAQKIYKHFSKYGDDIAKRAVLVAGMESGWRDSAKADTNIERSFGPFQINLNAHNRRVSKHTGTSDIDKNAKWLQNMDNSLIIAEEIWKEQGFSPWTAARKSVKTPLGVLGNQIMDL